MKSEYQGDTGDYNLLTNDYPLEISGFDNIFVNNINVININDSNISYELYNHASANGIFAFDGVTQFSSFQNIIISSDTKLGIGYTVDEAKTLANESFHIKEGGANITGNTTIDGDLTITGTTTTIESTNLSER